MTRRYWIVLAAALAACSRPPLGAGSLLPPNVAGVWQRKSLRDTPPPQPGVVRALQAAYEGAGQLTVDLYETRSSGTAFEMTQHRREQPNTVFFDKGRYFVVVQWRQADRNALTAFVRALQKELGALGGSR